MRPLRTLYEQLWKGYRMVDTDRETPNGVLGPCFIRMCTDEEEENVQIRPYMTGKNTDEMAPRS